MKNMKWHTNLDMHLRIGICRECEYFKERSDEETNKRLCKCTIRDEDNDDEMARSWYLWEDEYKKLYVPSECEMLTEYYVLMCNQHKENEDNEGEA